MELDRTCVVLASGGLDSTVLMHLLVKELGEKPLVIHFRYGQRHYIESQMLQAQAKVLELPVHEIDMKWWGQMLEGSALTNTLKRVPHIKEVLGHPQPPTYVPMRNMILLSIAASIAESNKVERVYYAAQRHDQYGYWDTTPEFVEAINSVFGLNRLNKIQVVTPLIDHKKADIVRFGQRLDVCFELTHSCYNPRYEYIDGTQEMKAISCRYCPTCSERLKGFEEVGIEDPLEYAPIVEEQLQE